MRWMKTAWGVPAAWLRAGAPAWADEFAATRVPRDAPPAGPDLMPAAAEARPAFAPPGHLPQFQPYTPPGPAAASGPAPPAPMPSGPAGPAVPPGDPRLLPQPTPGPMPPPGAGWPGYPPGPQPYPPPQDPNLPAEGFDAVGGWLSGGLPEGHGAIPANTAMPTIFGDQSLLGYALTQTPPVRLPNTEAATTV